MRAWRTTTRRRSRAANLVARTGTGGTVGADVPVAGVNFYANVTGGTNGIAPRRQWRLSMAAGDQRFTYFVTPSTTVVWPHRRAARSVVALCESAGAAARLLARTRRC